MRRDVMVEREHDYVQQDAGGNSIQVPILSHRTATRQGFYGNESSWDAPLLSQRQ
jgi:hypothetical protein